jgi:hypothetical protein
MSHTEENCFAPSGPQALECYLERLKWEMADKLKFLKIFSTNGRIPIHRGEALSKPLHMRSTHKFCLSPQPKLYERIRKYRLSQSYLGQKSLSPPKDGPYPIMQVHTNGTVTLQKGNVTQRCHICQIVHFQE